MKKSKLHDIIHASCGIEIWYRGSHYDACQIIAINKLIVWCKVEDMMMFMGYAEVLDEGGDHITMRAVQEPIVKAFIKKLTVRDFITHYYTMCTRGYESILGGKCRCLKERFKE